RHQENSLTYEILFRDSCSIWYRLQLRSDPHEAASKQLASRRSKIFMVVSELLAGCQKAQGTLSRQFAMAHQPGKLFCSARFGGRTCGYHDIYQVMKLLENCSNCMLPSKIIVCLSSDRSHWQTYICPTPPM